MKNKIIKEIVENHFSLRLFILKSIDEILFDSDKDYCRIEYNNSNLMLCFNDFDIIIDDNYTIKFKNTNRSFDKADFQKIEALNLKILSYSQGCSQAE